MGNAVKRTISLPAELAQEIDEISKTEGRSVSSIVQDALRLARTQRLKNEFSEIQGFWSNRARDAGILTQKDLDKRELPGSARELSANVVYAADRSAGEPFLSGVMVVVKSG